MLNQTQQEAEPVVQSTIAQYDFSPTQDGAPVSAVEHHTLTRAEMAELEKRLGSKNKRVSGPAEQQLALMDSSDLMTFIAYEKLNRNKKIKITVASVVSLYVFFIAVSIFGHTHMLGALSSFSSIIVGAAAFSNAHKSGIVALSRMEKTESIGELVSALEVQDKGVQLVVRPALITMLPKLKKSDSKLLGDTSRQTLLRFLKGKFSAKLRGGEYATDTQLRIATLNALKQVGDGSFIEIVSTMAKGEGNWPFRLNAEVIAAAQDCLPYLQQRAIEATASNELMRASHANSVGGADILVRPATGTVEMHEAELLRPSDEAQPPRLS